MIAKRVIRGVDEHVCGHGRGSRKEKHIGAILRIFCQGCKNIAYQVGKLGKRLDKKKERGVMHVIYQVKGR